MVNVQYRQYRAPISSNVYSTLDINVETDNGITAQTCGININNDVLSINWENVEVNGETIRARACNINGVYSGYLSNNCGIAVKSKTATIQALTNGLTEMPTDMKIVAELINPSGNQYVSDGDVAVLVYTDTNGVIEDFATIIDNATSVQNMYFASGALITPKDSDFAPIVRIRANTMFQKRFFYQYHNSPVDASTISTWDYVVDANFANTTIGGVNFSHAVVTTDNILEQENTKYFTDGFYYNIFENIDLWFYSTDGEDYHCFTEDVASELLTLGNVLTGNVKFTGKSFRTKNAHLLKDKKAAHKFYPYFLLK